MLSVGQSVNHYDHHTSFALICYTAGDFHVSWNTVANILWNILTFHQILLFVSFNTSSVSNCLSMCLFQHQIGVMMSISGHPFLLNRCFVLLVGHFSCGTADLLARPNFFCENKQNSQLLNFYMTNDLMLDLECAVHTNTFCLYA